MGCYLIPATGALVHYLLRRKKPSMRESKYHLWLNLLLVGGAIFGAVDHLWNGELFMLGNNIVSDLSLGVVITMVILAAWGILVLKDKANAKATSKATS